MKSNVLIAAVLCLGIFFSGNCRAQNVEMGILSSPRHAGLTARFSFKSGTPSILRAYADLHGVLDGKYSQPGYKTDYHVMFPFFSSSFRDGTVLEIAAGPGAMAGYARDRSAGRGAVFGLSALLSADFRFNVPIVISLGVSASIGGHVIFDDRFGGTMKFYRNGIYDAWIPELSIRYRF